MKVVQYNINFLILPQKMFNIDFLFIVPHESCQVDTTQNKNIHNNKHDQYKIKSTTISI